ncbi:MAG TPA: hypothetical protein VLI39_14250 [Sedimentisphaerales bacterium]|nr:hypothetical protein [Sedimentisphaerales bacterium]
MKNRVFGYVTGGRLQRVAGFSSRLLCRILCRFFRLGGPQEIIVADLQIMLSRYEPRIAQPRTNEVLRPSLAKFGLSA